MNVNELRTLVGNLDEFIHVPDGIDRLRKTVLHLAVSGKLVPQKPSEGSGSDLLDEIRRKRSATTSNGNARGRRSACSSRLSAKNALGLPSTWAEASLRELAYIATGKTPSTSISSYYGSAVPFIGPGQIQASKIVGATKWLSEDGSLVSVIAKPGTTLFVCIGGTIGKAALVAEDTCFNQQLTSLTPVLVAPRFIFHYVRSPFFQEAVRSQTSGGATPIINSGRLASLPCPLPPLGEQERIVSRVEELFTLIEELETVHKAEEAQRRVLTRVAFQRLVDKKDRIALDHVHELIRTTDDLGDLERAILKLVVSGQLVAQESPGGTFQEAGVIEHDIPQGWAMARLGELAEMRNGRAFKSSEWCTEGLPIVRIQNLNNAYAGYNYVDPSIVEAKHLIADGDVLLSWSGTPGTSFGVFIWQKGAGALNQHIFKCVISPRISKRWFQMAVNIGISGVLATAHGGVGLKHLTKRQLEALPVPIPPLVEQERAVAKVDELLKLVGGLRTKLAV